MAHSHCKGPGPGLGPGLRLGLGPGMMDFYITLCTVHNTQGQRQGIIVFYCAHPGPRPSSSPIQCV